MKRRHPAVFMEKDGTLVRKLPFDIAPERQELTSGAADGLRMLHEAGYLLVVVTNQPGLALGLVSTSAFTRWREALMRQVRERCGVPLAAVQHCPHAPGSAMRPGCACRTPEAGMLFDAAERLGLDLQRSWMIGDLLDDVEAGHRAGARSVLLDAGHETRWDRSPLREPDAMVPDLGAAARFIVAQDHAATCRRRSASVGAT